MYLDIYHPYNFIEFILPSWCLFIFFGSFICYATKALKCTVFSMTSMMTKHT